MGENFVFGGHFYGNDDMMRQFDIQIDICLNWQWRKNWVPGKFVNIWKWGKSEPKTQWCGNWRILEMKDLVNFKLNSVYLWVLF